jgi:hypothetical protein
MLPLYGSVVSYPGYNNIRFAHFFFSLTCDVQSLSFTCLQAKKFVESAPQDVKEGVNKEDAKKLAAALEAAGGTVEIV